MPPPNTTFVIPQHPDPSTKTQHTSACDTAVGAHDLECSELYQSTSNRVNNDVKDKENSQSF